MKSPYSTITRTSSARSIAFKKVKDHDVTIWNDHTKDT
jgi:hypothetical protein